MGFAMPSLVSAFYDAAVSPEAWPQALSALTDAAGVAGAAMIIFNKSSGNVDEVCFSGLSAGFKSDYVSHYAALDPFSPLLDGSWKKLSECLPAMRAIAYFGSPRDAPTYGRGPAARDSP